ncbi:PIN domain-containing protein [Aquimarina sp. 2201CG14-23]|uniref:PIN domain-containing protein n=1 Tax=Aquimarina mycalae TaxID=3040073 RepID=UPI002477E56D|nr:PIN domain-containing protein [Aquimarina sp. 2201CG14-23]MDH7444648.1 PIN domain-containing protein [Aquimarina sp. 2201CG14-23]
MINYVFLDTNILRGLGVPFYEKVNYKNLIRYCNGSGSDLIILNIVIKEYLDFYKREIVTRKTDDLLRSLDKIKILKSFSNIQIEDIANRAERELDFISMYIGSHSLQELEVKPKIDSDRLVDFLIENKQYSRKDDTRDYLIWISIIEWAKLNEDDQIVFISNDKVFKTNPLFRGVLKDENINNVIVFDSIPSFLNVYGYKSDQINKDLIRNSITHESISSVIYQDQQLILEAISGFYSDSLTSRPDIEEFEVEQVKIKEYYSFKDLTSGKIKIYVSTLIKLLIKFKPEIYVDILKKYLIDIQEGKVIDRLGNKFDKRYRPIFDNHAHFFLILEFNERTSKIENIINSDSFYLNDFV